MTVNKNICYNAEHPGLVKCWTNFHLQWTNAEHCVKIFEMAPKPNLKVWAKAQWNWTCQVTKECCCTFPNAKTQLTKKEHHFAAMPHPLGRASCAFNGHVNLSHSFIVQFYSTVLCDNFQNCSMNSWHNFMRQFYTRFFSADHSELHPFFHVFRILKWCTLERTRLCYKTVG